MLLLWNFSKISNFTTFNSFYQKWFYQKMADLCFEVSFAFMSMTFTNVLIFLYFTAITALYQNFSLYRIIRYGINEFSHNEGLIGPNAYWVPTVICNLPLLNRNILPRILIIIMMWISTLPIIISQHLYKHQLLRSTTHFQWKYHFNSVVYSAVCMSK
jgi:hypothetical protein